LSDSSPWTLHYRGSHNGTFVDGHRVPPNSTAPVSRGARINVGRFKIDVRTDGEPEITEHPSSDSLESTETFIVSADDPISNPLNLDQLRESLPHAADAQHRMRCLLAIEQANLELLGFESLAVLYGKVLDLVMQAVRPGRAALFVTDSDNQLVRKAARGSTDADPIVISKTLVGKVMRDNVSILIPHVDDSGVRLTDSLESSGIRCVMAVPLRHEKRNVGLIYADSDRMDTRFEEEDLRVLTALANISATRIEMARLLQEERELMRHDQELEAAAAVQRRLLPREPSTIDGYSVDGFNRPCFEVGGDFFDYLPLGGNRHGVVLADVAGKGLPAAMLLMGVQAYTRAYVGLRASVDGLADFLNDGMLRYAPRNRFVSYFFLEIDADAHSVRWCNAGHAPCPTIVRADGSMQQLAPDGPPLGVLPDRDFPVVESVLQHGDLLVVCSDGVTDAAAPDKEPFGEERLEQILRSMVGRSPREVRHTILEAVADHVQGSPASDDLTVVAVRRDPLGK